MCVIMHDWKEGCMESMLTAWTCVCDWKEGCMESKLTAWTCVNNA